MDDEHEHEPGDVVDSPQAGELAGNHATSGNDGDPIEDSHNDPDESDPDDEPGGSDETDDEPDETGDETAPGLARARQQAARYRRQLRDVEADRDELAAALWTERVAALGMLADPEDLPLDADALHDPDRMRELAGELVAAKPHLRSRRIRERAGQGEGNGTGDVSLAALLHRNA